MVRVLKLLFLGIIFCGLLLLLIWRSFNQELATYASAKIASVAIANNIFLNFSEAKFGLISFESKQLDLDLSNRKLPLILTINNLKVRPVLSSLFSSEQSLDVSFDVLHGKAEGRVYFRGQEFGIKDFKAQNIQIFQLPFFQMFGVSSGSLNLNLPNLKVTPNSQEIDQLKFQFIDLVKKESSVVPSLISGLPFNLNLEPINIKELSGLVNLDDDLLIKDLALVSDWGNVKTECQLDMMSKPPKIINGQGKVELAELGAKQFADFLPLISNQKLNSATRNFDFKLLGYQYGMPKLDFKPR